MNGPVNVPGVSYPEFKNHGNHVPAAETADNARFLRNDNTWQKVTPESIGAAAKNHGNHVPAAETADNAKFLRNDNTWQKVTPESIGAVTKTRVTEMINTALGVIENGTY